MKHYWKTIVVILIISLLLPMTAAAADGGGTPFQDIPEGAWYTDDAAFVFEKGWMQGTGNAFFSPETALTRAQLVKSLWTVSGAPVVNFIIPYDDIAAEAWYTEAVRWAAAERITDRTNGAFIPDQPLTREEAALLLWNTAKYLGVDVTVGEDTNILSYSDALDITEGYSSAVQWAVGSGVMQGPGGDELDVKGQLTRAQMAAMLHRFDKALHASPLSYWTEGSPAADALTGYIKAVTDPSGPDFIPVEDRIAVFDFDGTLFCETDPNYFDYMLLMYRVLEDPGYKDKASEFEREVANKIKEQNETGKSFSELATDHGRAVASSFAGMTLREFNDYIQAFKQQTMPSYSGMLRGEGFYLPMVQVVEYLQANDFTVYIVSGTDRLIVRGIFDGNILNIPNRQIIGSDETIVASKQGERDGLDYLFDADDELILGGEFIIKNLKMNKVSVIMQEIGQQPVLSFGNSSGDSSMAEYVISNNPYKSLAFMLCCDDLERENGSISKANDMYKLCETYGWLPISMKNDWTTIYGNGVTYLPGAAAADANNAA